MAGVLHARPGLFCRQRAAFLQKLDGDVVGRAHKGHAPVARRPVDRDALIHQLLAGLVNVIDLIGEVAEIAPARVFFGRAAFFGRPVIGCLLYPSDAADDSLRVDLGGRRMIQKEKNAKPPVTECA